jgi:hypothetical protein
MADCLGSTRRPAHDTHRHEERFDHRQGREGCGELRLLCSSDADAVWMREPGSLRPHKKQNNTALIFWFWF